MRQLIQGTVLLLLGSMAGLVMVEIGLRVIGFTYPAWEIRDPDLGFIGLPGAEGVWRAEGPGYVKFNSHGFRDAERAFEKPENGFRIAVLGDSFVQSREVKFEEGFVPLAEREVAACLRGRHRNVELLNFGVGGYNTAAELQLLRKRVWSYDPDVVVLFFFISNDVQNNHPDMDYYRDTPGLGIPLFKEERGEVVIDTSFRDDPLFEEKMNSPFHRIMVRLINLSATLQVLNYARHHYKNWYRTWLAANGTDPATQEPDAVDVWIKDARDVLIPPKNRSWREAWRLTEAGLSRMANEVRARGADFWLALIAHPPQVHADADKEPSTYPQRRLRSWAGREGVPVIDLFETFRARFKETGRYLYGFVESQRGNGHWNQDGHRLVARELSSRLCAAYGTAGGS